MASCPEMTQELQETLDKLYKELVKTIDGDTKSAEYFDPADDNVTKVIKFLQKSSDPTLRLAIIKQTRNLLSEQTDPLLIQKIWELLSSMIDELSHTIDDLSSEEDEELYETLVHVQDLPLLVRGKYITKLYEFFIALPVDKRPKPCGFCNEYEEECNDPIAELKYQMEEVIDQLDPEFVANALLDSYEKKLTTSDYMHFHLLASYVLSAEDVKSQTERYEKVVQPILEHCLTSWHVLFFYVTKWNDDGYWAKKNTCKMLEMIYSRYLHYVVQEKNMVPTKIFADIQTQLGKGLSVEENYKTLTTWKLITTYVTVLEEQIKETGEITNDICFKAVPKFSQLCLQYLRKDIDKYNLSAYSTFADCLYNVFKSNTIIYSAFKYKKDMKMVHLKLLDSLLEDEEFVPSYLVVLESIPQEYEQGGELGRKLTNIREKIFKNPSDEVKLHYYKKYNVGSIDMVI
ncbi:hypothetical protein NE865_13203 [Phthorimaea operculella]|nr:hypothetical protein NE865_13203 [Phthorimaea operculella]